jgi:hypothetical protein
MLCFNVGSKEAFEVSLADVAQTQMQGKTDVVLEFHVDDTTGANEVRELPYVFQSWSSYSRRRPIMSVG